MRNPLHSLLAALLLFPLATLSGQSNQPSLEARLLNKPLYLRGFPRADTLRYDGAGKLLSSTETTAFTLSGVDIAHIELQGSGLVLTGRRVGLELEQKDARARVPLQVDGADELIHIEIALAPGADYTPALNAIFADDPGSLTPSFPAFWQVYARNNFLAPGNTLALHSDKELGILDKPLNKGGKASIVKPTLVRSVAPVLTPAAAALHYKANVIISLIVEKDGVPSHLQLLRPAGLGLDEQAITAVQKYIFHPATQRGRPVPVDLNVVVDFNGGNR